MVYLSKDQYNAVLAKFKSRKDRRLAKRQDNAALQATLTQDVRTMPKSGKSIKKAKTQSRAILARLLKKLGLELFKAIVRARDGNRCVMCGSTDYLNVHHWLYRKSHSVRLSMDPGNGVTLCAYPCHLGRIHHDGDGIFVLQLAEKMKWIVGEAKIAEMTEIGQHPSTVSLEQLREIVSALGATRGER